jgi:hypothetical protein
MGIENSSRIRSFYPFCIPDPGVKKEPNPGSATLAGCLCQLLKGCSEALKHKKLGRLYFCFFSRAGAILPYSPFSLVTGGGRPEQQLAAAGKVGAAEGVEGRRPLHGLPTGHGIRLRESFLLAKNLVQCCGSGSGIRCLFDPWIRDPEWFFPGSRIPDPKTIF